jgi:single-strand DNA-binding protein
MSDRNVVVLRGTLTTEPRPRALPSGTALVQFDLTTRDDGGTQSVPVAWFDPPPAASALTAGEEVLVVGSVRRRFFRSGGVTQSRTEVVATRVVPARRGREVAKALAAVCRRLAGPVAGDAPA